MFIITNLAWEYFYPYFEKQDGRHRRFFVSHEKCLYLPFIIGPRGLQCETNLWAIMGWESSDVRFDLGPLLQGQTMIAKLSLSVMKSAYNSLIIGPRGLQCETNL